MAAGAGALYGLHHRLLRPDGDRHTETTLIAFEPASDFHAAARIYRRCRAAGITPRGMIDCMIAAVAFRNQATLLAHDADLIRIARVLDLGLDTASLRGAG